MLRHGVEVVLFKDEDLPALADHFRQDCGFPLPRDPEDRRTESDWIRFWGIAVGRWDGWFDWDFFFLRKAPPVPVARDLWFAGIGGTFPETCFLLSRPGEDLLNDIRRYHEVYGDAHIDRFARLTRRAVRLLPQSEFIHYGSFPHVGGPYVGKTE